METIIKNVLTFSITFSADYDKAFDFLSHPINQKEWAIHFIKDVEQTEDGFVATLPFGKLPMAIKSDRVLGTLDYYVGEAPFPTRTRLIQVDEATCVYNFVLAKPENMPELVWENEAIPNMEEEMSILQSILEAL